MVASLVEHVSTNTYTPIKSDELPNLSVVRNVATSMNKHRQSMAATQTSLHVG